MTKLNNLLVLIVAQQVLFTQFLKITAKCRLNVNMYFVNCYKSSNVKEVIRAVLNLFFFFFTKRFYTHKNKKGSVFMCLKNVWEKKSHLCTYLRFLCFFMPFMPLLGCIWEKKSYLFAYLRFCAFVCPLCSCLVVFLCLLFLLCM